MQTLLKFVAALSVPALVVLVCTLAGLVIVFVLRHFAKNPQASEHALEAALEHAVATVERMKAVAPAGAVLNDAEIGLNALDVYLKENDLPVAPEPLKIALLDRLKAKV